MKDGLKTVFKVQTSMAGTIKKMLCTVGGFDQSDALRLTVTWILIGEKMFLGTRPNVSKSLFSFIQN